LTVGNRIEELADLIGKAAKTVAYQWPTVVDEDDIQQDIYINLLESPGSVDKLLDDFEAKDRLNAIIAIGHKIASKERLDYEVFSGNFRYSVNEVKRMLEKGGLRGNSTKSSAFQDLHQSLDGISQEYRECLWSKYVQNITPTSGYDKTQVSRALEALTTEMNRSFKNQPNAGPGSRAKISAAKARQISKTDWDDDSSEAVQRLQNQARASGR
jgi:hypothetical protein